MSNVVDPVIKVTRIGDKWHCRILLKEEVLTEMACENKQDIGWCFREMLRRYSKLGYPYSALAEAARDRQCSDPIGKVHYIKN